MLSFIGIGGLLVFIISLVIPYFFQLLFSEEYYEAILILEWQLWYIYIFGVISFIGTVWAAIDKERLSFKMATINMVIMTPLLWYGSYDGGKGLAMTYLIGISIFTIIVWFVFIKSLKLQLKLSFIWLVPLTFFISKFLFL